MLSNNCIKLAFSESIGCKTHSLFISDIFRWSNAPWILVEEIKGHSRLAGKFFHPNHPTLTLSHLDLSLTSRTLNSERRWWESESHYGDSHISLNVTVMHKTIWHRGLEVKTPPDQVQHLSHGATQSINHTTSNLSYCSEIRCNRFKFSVPSWFFSCNLLKIAGTPLTSHFRSFFAFSLPVCPSPQ